MRLQRVDFASFQFITECFYWDKAYILEGNGEVHMKREEAVPPFCSDWLIRPSI